MRSQDRLREREGIDSSGAGIAAAGYPTVSGTPTVGQTLTGTNASFNGAPTITITRAWLRDGTPIEGATGATYLLAVADEGAVIRFRNTATNAFGSVTVDSLPTAAVAAA